MGCEFAFRSSATTRSPTAARRRSPSPRTRRRTTVITSTTAALPTTNTPRPPAPGLQLDNADIMTINQLALTGGTLSLWVHDGSANLTAAYLNVHDNTQEGIRVESNSSVLDLGNSTITHNGYGGPYNHQSG